MKVFRCGRQTERIDRKRPLLDADGQIGAAKEAGKVLIAAAQVKDISERPILLQVRQQEIHQKTLAAAGGAENCGVGNVLVMEIEKVRRADPGLKDRQVF